MGGFQLLRDGSHFGLLEPTLNFWREPFHEVAETPGERGELATAPVVAEEPDQSGVASFARKLLKQLLSGDGESLLGSVFCCTVLVSVKCLECLDQVEVSGP